MSWEKRKKDSSVFQFGLSLEVYMYTCGVLVFDVYGTYPRRHLLPLDQWPLRSW